MAKKEPMAGDKLLIVTKSSRSIKIDEDAYQILRRWAYERASTIQELVTETVKQREERDGRTSKGTR